MPSDPHPVTLIPGDGIGPEVTDAAQRAVAATGARIAWEQVDAGADVVSRYGTPLPETVLQSIRKNGVALKGPVGTPVGGGFKSVNVSLRQSLELYACVRPVRTIPGVPSRFESVDLVVVRENTEGLYSGLEHRVAPGIVESLKVMTETACTRISRYAFALAEREHRRKVTAIHKANIMKLSDGLFLECCRRVAREYEHIEYEELIVDNACMQLVMDPTRYDVLVSENLYGDILSDLGAGLVGGLGFAPGANKGDRVGVYEPVHGTAPDIAGRGLANPIASVLSGVMMLRQLDESAAADRLKDAVLSLLEKGEVRTGDMGGSATTDEMRSALLREIESTPEPVAR